MNISPTRDGRWKVEKVMEDWHGYADWTTYTVRDARNCCIAVVGEVDRLPAPENADNARLMACAPELLKALQDIENAATAANTIIQNMRPDGQIAYDLSRSITAARAAIISANPK
jgi:hypothetical protein